MIKKRKDESVYETFTEKVQNAFYKGETKVVIDLIRRYEEDTHRYLVLFDEELDISRPDDPYPNDPRTKRMLLTEAVAYRNFELLDFCKEYDYFTFNECRGKMLTQAVEGKDKESIKYVLDSIEISDIHYTVAHACTHETDLGIIAYLLDRVNEGKWKSYRRIEPLLMYAIMRADKDVIICVLEKEEEVYACNCFDSDGYTECRLCNINRMLAVHLATDKKMRIPLSARYEILCLLYEKIPIYSLLCGITNLIFGTFDWRWNVLMLEAFGKYERDGRGSTIYEILKPYVDDNQKCVSYEDRKKLLEKNVRATKDHCFYNDDCDSDIFKDIDYYTSRDRVELTKTLLRARYSDNSPFFKDVLAWQILHKIMHMCRLFLRENE